MSTVQGAEQRRPSAPSPGREARRDRTPTLAQRENRTGLAFVSPTLLVVLVVVILPIAWTVLLAFQHARLVDIQGMDFLSNWTWKNFTEVFTSPGFWTSLWTTLAYTVGATVGSILLGLVAALA